MYVGTMTSAVSCCVKYQKYYEKNYETETEILFTEPATILGCWFYSSIHMAKIFVIPLIYTTTLFP